jgi:hypothetical protein
MRATRRLWGAIGIMAPDRPQRRALRNPSRKRHQSIEVSGPELRAVVPQEDPPARRRRRLAPQVAPQRLWADAETELAELADTRTRGFSSLIWRMTEASSLSTSRGRPHRLPRSSRCLARRCERCRCARPGYPRLPCRRGGLVAGTTGATSGVFGTGARFGFMPVRLSDIVISSVRAADVWLAREAALPRAAPT